MTHGNSAPTSTVELYETKTALAALLEHLPVGVLVEDSDRTIVAANPALCEILGVGVEPADLIGRNCDRMAEELKSHFADADRAVARIETVLAQRDPVRDEEVRLADGRTLERTYVPYTLPDGEANLWLYRDVTERNARRQELERKNELLEEFVGAVSHDLRNPLNVATANLESAAANSDSEYVDAAMDALDRTELLLEDLLVLAREGAVIGETEPVDLAETVRDCWTNVATADATLEVDTDRVVEADRSRLAQVLENLFRNAVEHGGRDVRITVGAVANGFYVADDGRGVAANESDLFDEEYSTSADGIGLGLRIVEKIVDAHGWEIGVEESRSGGARFVITGVEFVD
ncbi:PAS domain-containing sensor histidine kinase [Natrinema sp. 1APR25-10V2]|uniref:PAS domain-containing sensor histidine kinase n=1 Tax=Natrinema sp. 1APR25-10V2 TaxID=2951081 RepID=UPI002876A6FC|nr:PAS domain-containing sensor histidine kinase [Natrinema sp. 1APR25-10V2]MDS0475792.1 PAS domain-containing sensor histidine kinase [Natrinema sp. 1APR25-10V2]